MRGAVVENTGRNRLSTKVQWHRSIKGDLGNSNDCFRFGPRLSPMNTVEIRRSFSHFATGFISSTYESTIMYTARLYTDLRNTWARRKKRHWMSTKTRDAVQTEGTSSIHVDHTGIKKWCQYNSRKLIHMSKHSDSRRWVQMKEATRWRNNVHRLSTYLTIHQKMNVIRYHK